MTRFLPAALAALALAAPADAASFFGTFTIIDPATRVESKGTAIITTEQTTAPGQLRIIGLEGSFKGSPVTLLPPDTFPIFAPNTNFLYLGGQPLLDPLGLSFAAGGTNWNFFTDDGTFGTTPYLFCSGAVDCDVLGAADFAITPLNVSAVPEPSTWALLLVGFGMVGFAQRRRRRASARPIFA